MGDFNFITYYCEWFDHDDEIFWFPTFKRVAREKLRLMSTDDIDFQALRSICAPSMEDLYDVAKICFNHNETYFREEVLSWIDSIRDGNHHHTVKKNHTMSLRPHDGKNER